MICHHVYNLLLLLTKRDHNDDWCEIFSVKRTKFFWFCILLKIQVSRLYQFLKPDEKWWEKSKKNMIFNLSSMRLMNWNNLNSMVGIVDGIFNKCWISRFYWANSLKCTCSLCNCCFSQICSTVCTIRLKLCWMKIDENYLL